MNPEVVAFAQVAVIIVLLAGSLATMGVLTMRAVLRTRRQEPSSIRQADERLERLQQSVDAIAVEVERIGEAQRFRATLLAERVPSSHE